MKLVGICEKIAVISMFGVIGILFVATMLSETTELSTKFYSNNNMLALYSMIAFSLSAVMSVPQVVKGLEGDEKGIRKAIAAGTGLNMGLILLITFMTLLGCSNVTENGALVDLSGHLGGWVSIIGYVFSLLALATSFWANTLNLRDIVNEQLACSYITLSCDRTCGCAELCWFHKNGKCGSGSDRSRSDCCIQSFQKTCGN